MQMSLKFQVPGLKVLDGIVEGGSRVISRDPLTLSEN